jgi:hypothetical protein
LPELEELEPEEWSGLGPDEWVGLGPEEWSGLGPEEWPEEWVGFDRGPLPVTVGVPSAVCFEPVDTLWWG